jgi:hypothetical protein
VTGSLDGAVSASSSAATAVGVKLAGDTVTLSGDGSTAATSGTAGAQGLLIAATGDVSVAGGIDASASAAQAATGVGITSGGDVSLSLGSVSAVSTAASAQGIAVEGAGISVSIAGGVAATGHVDATAVELDGTTLAFDNAGAIGAEAAGVATGVLVSASGSATMANAGTISAIGGTEATAVSFGGAAATVGLDNSGTITATAAGESGVAVALAADAAFSLANTGTINGAIVTRGGDDFVGNGTGGTWNVVNGATDFGAGDDGLDNLSGGTVAITGGTIDFGAGDDAIRNLSGGTIALADGGIHMGSSTEAGNSFVNAGTISVSGDSLIDMGTGADVTPAGIITAMSFSPMAAPNPVAFANDGIIDFVDGTATGVLTIAGDFAGQGDINLEVDLLNGTSDLLYIDGDVVDGTQQTVNLAVEGVASIDQAPTPFLTVTGSVAEGAFTLGKVTGLGSGNFLDMTLGLSEATDGDATVFSFNAKVNGLNRTGVLAANMAPGAQTLIASAIGTMRQRAGAQASASDYGMGPWVRFFDNSGDVDPAHTQDFGTAGDFRFEQMNRGLEFGMGFDFDGPVGFGIMLGNADAKQKMNDGSGSDHLEMSSVGLYGTWTMPAFYVDLSFRWMDLDATLMSSAGETRGSGNATASNIEAGYTGWNMGGFDIVPQAQYTRSTVDIDPLDGSEVSFESGQSDSSRGRLGVEIARSFDAAGFSWRPYAAASMVREFDGDGSYTIADAYSGTTSIEGTSTLLEAGIGARIGSFSGTFGVNWSDGGALDSMLGGNLVLRYNW